ncbi:MAG: hypothetical protein LBS19_12715 [Clostridiales bacterium]|jgi:hypothetical protein|nr:hypothetical protein [Clostridiales bacterium]
MKTERIAARAAAGYVILTAAILALTAIFHGRPDVWEFLLYDIVPYYRETPGDRLKEYLFQLNQRAQAVTR